MLGGFVPFLRAGAFVRLTVGIGTGVSIEALLLHGVKVLDFARLWAGKRQ